MRSIGFKMATLMTALMSTMTVYAKSQDVGGRVINENGQPLPFVNVVLLSLPDSAFVQGAVTDENGMFNIVTDISDGLFKVTSVGYQTLYINAWRGTDHPDEGGHPTTQRGCGERSVAEDSCEGRRHAHHRRRYDTGEGRNGERCPVEDSIARS